MEGNEMKIVANENFTYMHSVDSEAQYFGHWNTCNYVAA